MPDPAVSSWSAPLPDLPLYAPLARWALPCPESGPAQALFDALLANARTRGQALPPGLRFVCGLTPADYYELHVGRHGEVPTRPANWHDWFNALAWLAWPKAKAALNARHVRAIEARRSWRRPPSRWPFAGPAQSTKRP